MALLQQAQHTAPAARRGTLAVAVLAAAGILAGVAPLAPIAPLACLLSGCGGTRAQVDAGLEGGAQGDVAKALAIARGDEVLPERAEALALAESIEAHAVREGAGPRAVELHAAAARLVERVWRVEGRDQDA
ncbi:MAG TPA: hypothetical protein VIY73_08570, partial [Polyangiaceae bacterium]